MNPTMNDEAEFFKKAKAKPLTVEELARLLQTDPATLLGQMRETTVVNVKDHHDTTSPLLPR